MKTNLLKNEQGRSMVEMLGVLAVIGVLSVAGIAAYSTAMNQHRANETVNTAMRAAVMLSAQRLANPSATLSANGLDGAITVGNDTDKLVLTLSNVDDKVRSRIEAMGLKNATIGSDGNGALTFTFNNELSERGSSNSGGNSSGGSGQQEPVVDPCAGFTATICTTACTNDNGTAVYTYAEEGTSCDAYGRSACDGEGVCNQCPSNAYALLSGNVNTNEKTNVAGCYCYRSSHFVGDLCSGGSAGGGL